MKVDFLSLLNSSNSIKKEGTNEFIITSPNISIDDKCVIRESCKISSNCKTTIQCKRLKIKSASVSFSDINFETPIKVFDSENFAILNCTTNAPKITKAAFQISNCQKVTINHLEISHTNKFPGILILQNSNVTVYHLNIHDIDTTLVACFSNSSLKVTDSTFHHSSANGILADDQTYIEIENTTFSDMGCPAIFIENSKCKIRNNKIKNVEQNGLTIINCKEFLIEKNDFTSIKATAISVSNNSSGVVDANTIYEIGGNGIMCSDKSNVQVTNNDIHNLSYPSISVSSNSIANLVGNRINEIKFSGIAIRRAKEVTIKNSVINNIGESGISVSDSECCYVTDNKISNCSISSIEGYNKSSVFVDKNEITNAGKYAFLAYTSGHIKAEKNTIKNISNAMVKLAYKGGGDFINNDVSNCPNQCDCQTSSAYFFSGNGEFKAVTNDPERKSDDVLLEKLFVEKSSLCLKCHKNQRDYFLLDCGHKVYCKECAELALKNKEECPLCRFPIEKVSNGFGVKNDDMCIICFDKPVDCIILPCGHMGFCSSCVENWFNNKKCCPICRSEPSFYKEIEQDISA